MPRIRGRSVKKKDDYLLDQVVDKDRCEPHFDAALTQKSSRYIRSNLTTDYLAMPCLMLEYIPNPTETNAQVSSIPPGHTHAQHISQSLNTAQNARSMFQLGEPEHAA